MPLELSFTERRVLGVLIEKGYTTPDQYPLTLNAVVVGSNQKSCRDPVASIDEEAVLDSLESLRHKGFVICVRMEGSRADRWKHRTGECLDLESREVALLAELLLRGPQTDGELRQRASRMVPLGELKDVEGIIGKLSTRDEPLVHRLGPPGKRRGVKFAHKLYPPDEQPAPDPERSSWSGYPSSPPTAAAQPSIPTESITAVATEPLPEPQPMSSPSLPLPSPSAQVSEPRSSASGIEAELRERIRKLEERVEELEATFVKFLR